MAHAASSFTICDKCFAEVLQSEPFCTECGAPVSDAPGAEGSDSVVYTDLSRANLLRMRGDHDQARTICLSILRRYPNNVSAHTLLGDISSDEDDLVHAAEWYEMALDLEPDKLSDRKKLDSVRQRIADHEAATTAQQLGIPTSRPKAKLFAAVVVCVVVIFGIGAFFLGDYLRGTRGNSIETAPVEIGTALADPGTSSPAETRPPAGFGQKDTSDPNQPASPSVGAVQDDQKLLATVQSKVAHGSSVFDAKYDPRPGSMSILITFALKDNEDPKAMAAEIGTSAIQMFSDIPKATVRAVRGGVVVLMADVNRSDAESMAVNPETQKPTKESLDAVLKNVLQAPSSEPPR